MSNEDTLLQFPTDFPLKVMGRNTADFRSVALGIVQKHTGDVDADKIEERPSSNGAYVGITFIVRATS